jgi:hypothetical protein
MSINVLVDHSMSFNVSVDHTMSFKVDYEIYYNETLLAFLNIQMM